MPSGIYKHKIQSVLIRFWSKVNVKRESECWEWKAGLNVKGYGQFRFNGKMTASHRVAWILTYGEIPNGLNILHTCDNRPCCNPAHLFKGTNADNAHDMMSKGRGADHSGLDNGRHKLTEQDVLEIRDKRLLGYKLKILSNQYGVSKSDISHICLRRTWKHI